MMASDERLSANGRPLDRRERVARRSSSSRTAPAPPGAWSRTSRRDAAVGQAGDQCRGNRVVTGGRGDVARGRARGFAGDRRVEQHRRHAGRQRLERCQAEAFVLRQEREHRGAAVKAGEGGVIDVRAQVDAIGDAATAGAAPRDRCAGAASGSRRRSRAAPSAPGLPRRQTPPSIDRPVVARTPSQRIARLVRRAPVRGRGLRPQPPHAERNHADARRRQADVPRNLALRERRVGEHRLARAGPTSR